MDDQPVRLSLNTSLMEIATDPHLRQKVEQVLGDFCHQGRNRLNSLKLSLYLAKRQASESVMPIWLALEQKYQDLEVQIDRVQTVCRPIGLSLVTIDLNLLFEDRLQRWSEILRDHGQTLEFCRAPAPNLARFDVNKLGMALDSLVNWRAEQADPGNTVTVRWWANQNEAQIIWTETSQTELPAVPEANLLPAWSLPILSRVVAEHQGLLHLDEQNGWQLTIVWPMGRS